MYLNRVHTIPWKFSPYSSGADTFFSVIQPASISIFGGTPPAFVKATVFSCSLVIGIAAYTIDDGSTFEADSAAGGHCVGDDGGGGGGGHDRDGTGPSTLFVRTDGAVCVIL